MRTFATFLVLVFACSGCEKDCEPAQYVVTTGAGEIDRSFDAPYEICNRKEARRVAENNGFEFSTNEAGSDCQRDSDCDGGACVFQITSDSMVDRDGNIEFTLTGPGGQTNCVPATCLSGADCESGICRAGFNGCNRVVSFGCATENDTCEEVDDCGWPNQGGCQPGEGGFQCRGQDCPIDE